MQALVSFLHALIDHTHNLVVICSGVTTSMDGLRERGIIPEAAWDRLGELRVDRLEVRKAEALDILLNRLDAFFAPYAHLQALATARTRDPLFPLGHHFWEQRTADLLQVRPRDVISWARFAWQRQQERLESEDLQTPLAAGRGAAVRPRPRLTHRLMEAPRRSKSRWASEGATCGRPPHPGAADRKGQAMARFPHGRPKS